MNILQRLFRKEQREEEDNTPQTTLENNLDLTLDEERFIENFHRQFLSFGTYQFGMHMSITGINKDNRIVDIPRIPLSIARIIKTRQRRSPIGDNKLDGHIATGDGIVYGVNGDALLVLDSEHLRRVTPDVDINNGIKLSMEEWETLRKKRDTVLYLSKEELIAAHQKGYVTRNKYDRWPIYEPENRAVAKVWKFLARGLDVSNYAQLVGTYNGGYPREYVLNIDLEYDYKTVTQVLSRDAPTLKPWCTGQLCRNLGAYISADSITNKVPSGEEYLLYNLIGEPLVAPFELEARIIYALALGKPFDFGAYRYYRKI